MLAATLMTGGTIARDMTGEGRGSVFKPERMLAFSDGVFAVAITLLVIDLRLPAGIGEGESALLAALLEMRERVLIFAFTFIIIGMSWLGHHQKFSHVRQVDQGLLWLNLLYLLALCLLPFVTSMLSEHPARITFIVYALAMAVLLSISAGLSAYSLRPPYLGHEISVAARQDMILSPLVTALIFLGAACLAALHDERAARWALLAIIPVAAYFGHRSRKVG